MSELSHGIYDALVDEYLQEALERRPELKPLLSKLDPEEQPSRYAAFVARVLEQALREEASPELRLLLCNEIVSRLAGTKDREHLGKHRMVPRSDQLLLEVPPPHYGAAHLPRPHTSLAESSLFTGSPCEPQLAHELPAEMASADAVDILISFIKWSGLRLLMPAFEDLRTRNVPVRIITTSYMGASDARAIEWLATMPNVSIRVSYDTDRTRLHAKAYHFQRDSGFSTAYIGSANMSQAAITSGLEWNLKVTASDMAHILEKFTVEFETYWNSREFLPFDPEDPTPLRTAIARARNRDAPGPTVFFDLRPHPFQERILEALQREREVHDRWRNLVVAATGTGKTMVAAFDFKRFFDATGRQAKLLYIAHRREILQQAATTFRSVLRDGDFGELLTGTDEASRLEHLFCTIGMLTNRRLWERVGKTFYDVLIVDETHHGTAASYRPIFENFKPRILLGLTATPERMDGGNVAADFGNRFAAEIRLPEALEERLLCPFHYFGVTDPVAIDDDRFWRSGRYDVTALENVYVMDPALAKRRVDAILSALERFESDLEAVKGIGFCVSIRHAEFMARSFSERGLPSAAFVSGEDSATCRGYLDDLRAGRLRFLFTVDKLSEGVDLPEVTSVLFLRPTESLTVFLQQLGRGLRHAPGKDCLTVLDFVGQVHRRYRLDTKFKALLPRHRHSIDREVEENFPHLPSGCSIQLDRLARTYVLQNIRANLGRLTVQVPERIQTFRSETGLDLTFGNFVRHHDYDPTLLLARETWSQWKARALQAQAPDDPDLERLRSALVRAASVDGPREIGRLRRVLGSITRGDVPGALAAAGSSAMSCYYRVWGDKGEKLGFSSLDEAFLRLSKNRSILADLDEILDWSLDSTEVAGQGPALPFPCPLELHARYGLRDILAALGHANLESAGQTGLGVLHLGDLRAYALLVTFQKTEREFSPSTMYADYPISRELLHWESQSNTTQDSPSGQNLIHHQERDYTILLFARDTKKVNGTTVPYTFLGPADRVSHESERPIRMVWRLRHPMPVQVFEDNRRGG